MNEIKRGTVWWCNFPNELNSRICGRRPCLVVSNDLCNRFSPLITVVPATSQDKRAMPTHYCLRILPNAFTTFLFEQVTVIDKSFLTDYIVTLTPDQMFFSDHYLRMQLGLS